MKISNILKSFSGLRQCKCVLNNQSNNVDGEKGIGEKKRHTNKKKGEKNNGLMILPIAAVRRRSVLAKAALRS